MPSTATAQGETDSNASKCPVQFACVNSGKRQDIRAWSLWLGSAIGYGVVRDDGTAPITFHGPLLMPTIGLQHTRRQWRYSIETATAIGYYENKLKPRFNFTTFDINNTIRLKALRRLRCDFMQLWVGAAVTNFLDVTVNMQYENAAAGVSEFVGPELWASASKQLGASRFSILGELAVMPVAATMRPGYAYIDNYTSAHPVLDALFDDYEWHGKAFAAFATAVGVDLRLQNGNHVALSYRWNYHSSGDSGQWRFDHAMHSLNLDLIFNLKQRINHE